MRCQYLCLCLIIAVGFANPATAESRFRFGGAIGVTETAAGLISNRGEIGMPFNLSVISELDKGEIKFNDLKPVFEIDADYRYKAQALRWYVFPWADHSGLYLSAGQVEADGRIKIGRTEEMIKGTGTLYELGIMTRFWMFYFSTAYRHNVIDDKEFPTLPTSFGISISF